jgi:mono/diheme cytochrome c family protein
MKRPMLFIAVGWLLLAQRTIAQNQSALNDAPGLINSLQGAELFKAYCAVCHGIDAKGNGPMAKSLKTATRYLERLQTK